MREQSCCTLENGLADMFRRVFSLGPIGMRSKSVVFEDQNGELDPVR